MAGPWAENTVTWNTAPLLFPTPVTVPSLGNGSTADVVSNVTTMVQNMILTGINNGFEISLTDNSNYYHGLNFASRENTDNNGAFQPELCVTYTVPHTTVCVPALKDAMLHEFTPTTNYGTNPLLRASRHTYSSGGGNGFYTTKVLHQFDLSSIPAGAIITSATMKLHVDTNPAAIPYDSHYDLGGGTGNGATVRQVATPWAENTVTWNTAPALLAPTVTVPSLGNGSTADVVSNVTAMVQNMVTSGINNGFEISLTDNSDYYHGLNFASRENTDNGGIFQPELCITYVLPQKTACLPALKDAMIHEFRPTTNYGSDPLVRASRHTYSAAGGNGFYTTKVLHQFDLSSIPTGAIILSATMKLHVDTNPAAIPYDSHYDLGGGTGNGATVRQVAAPWGENTVTWNTAPALLAGSVTVPSLGNGSTADVISNVTAMVQNMVTSGINNGFEISLTDNSDYYHGLNFASRENTDNGGIFQPELCITYVLPQKTACLPALKDAMLHEFTPTTNYGTNPLLRASRHTYSSGGGNGFYTTKALHQFDLSSIPTGAIILSATMKLHVDTNPAAIPYDSHYDLGGGTGNGATVRQVATAWSENTVTWNTAPALLAPTVTVPSLGNGSTADVISNVTAMVQNMVTSGINNGFEISLTDNTDYYHGLNFASRENTDNGGIFKPELCVTYTMPQIIACVPALKDSMIHEFVPTTNYGTFPLLRASRHTYSSGGGSGFYTTKALHQFDLSSIPAGATVSSATMKLHVDTNPSAIPYDSHYDLGGGTGNGATVKQVATSWGENTVTWSTAPSLMAGSVLVASLGNGSTADVVSNVTGMVQNMVTSGINNGFETSLTDNSDYYHGLNFASRENTSNNGAFQPELCVRYSKPLCCVTLYVDNDNDGYNNGSMVSCDGIIPQGYSLVTYGTDCDDTNPNVHPGAIDICGDGLDNDCNGVIDNVGQPGGCIPVLTSLPTASCGSTISNLSVTIVATNVAGAQGYRFKVTNLITSAVQIIDRPVNSFAFSNLVGITLGTPYQIEVALKLNNVWQPFYGPACSVTTPSPVCTIGSHCGTTVTSMSQYVYCTVVASVTGYRFRVTNLTTNAFAIVDSGLNRFSFNQVPLPVRAFGTTYSVEVALKNTDGSYLPYSIGCNISTRAFPTTTITAAQCGLTTATSYSTDLTAVVFSGATRYRFRLSSVSSTYSSVITKNINKVKLSEFASILPDPTYTVEVSLEVDGSFGNYGGTCTVTVTVINKITPSVTNEFKAIAYPNPFASDFMFNVNTSSESTIQIRVYDMLGKQIDNRNVEVSDIENLQIGANYPSGVYNVIVSQGENTQTLRVIKR